MLLYSEPIKDEDISIIAIYKSLNTAFEKEDVLADESLEDIVQVLDTKLIPEGVRSQTEILIVERKMNKARDETIRFVKILADLQAISDEGKGITDERIKTILLNYRYSQLSGDAQQRIQLFIKEMFNIDIEHKRDKEEGDYEDR